MSSVASSVTEQKSAHDSSAPAQARQDTIIKRTHSGVYRFVRKTHLWVSIIVALPLLLRLVTGVALQVRKPVDFIQPTTEVGVARYEPDVTHAHILAALKTAPVTRVDDWKDVKQIDYRPKKGVLKVHDYNDLETQIDAKTGEVIRTSKRWNNLLARIHDGSEWGMRLWFFLPAGLLIIYLWISGFYLGIMETLRKLRVRRQRKAQEALQASIGAPSVSRKRPFNLVRFCLRYHYWLAVLVLFPWMLVTLSGLMLQLRYELPHVDPGLRQGVSTTPTLTYTRVVEIASTIPELQVQNLEDLWRIYTHPNSGVIAVRTEHGIRAQLDANTGAVLIVEDYERDFWEDLHQGLIGRHKLRSGSPFGSLDVDLRFVLFLPIHLLALLLWLTGVIYFMKTTFARRKPRGGRVPAAVETVEDTELEPAQQPMGGD